jgi:alpha-glucosidase
MGRVTQTTTEPSVATVTAPDVTVHHADAPDAPWWRDAVIYQVYPR